MTATIYQSESEEDIRKTWFTTELQNTNETQTLAARTEAELLRIYSLGCQAHAMIHRKMEWQFPHSCFIQAMERTVDMWLTACGKSEPMKRQLVDTLQRIIEKLQIIVSVQKRDADVFNSYHELGDKCHIT